MPQYQASHIWHKSVSLCKISKPCRILEMFNISVWPERFLCRNQLVAPGHKSPRESKTVIQVSWPHLDDHVEAFQVGGIPEIFNFDVILRLIHTNSTFVTPFSKFIFNEPPSYLNIQYSWNTPNLECFYLVIQVGSSDMNDSFWLPRAFVTGGSKMTSTQ